MESYLYPSYTQGELVLQAKAYLRMLAEAKLPAIHTLTPAQVRENTWPAMKKLVGDSHVIASVENLTIPGPVGKLAVRVYTPEGKGPFPILVYFHGGWWVIWDLDVTDNLCRALANGASCVVVSVDYRLAPEHKHPAAVEFDILRDEGEAYASRLREAGAEVMCTRYKGELHDFPVLAGASSQAKNATDEASNAL